MTPAEITLVKDSFRQVVPIGDQAAALFYARLYEIEPSLRPLVHGDRIEQGRKLLAILATAIASLEQLDRITPAMRALAARHAQHGLRPVHYPTIGAALLWTLEKCLGPFHTAAVQDAWQKACAVLAHAMFESQVRLRTAA